MKKYDFKQETQEQVEESPAPVTIKKEVLVRSRIEARLHYMGQISGKSYEWQKAGQAIPVLDEDVPDLLGKRLGGKNCCGAGENIIFEIVQEA